MPGAKKKLVVRLSGERQAVLSFTGARLAPAEAGDTQVALVFRDISEEELIRRILGDFLANIAHEFRTPLSAAAASSELLMDQLQDLSQAELRELLNSLHLGILGLQTLVDNLLESASIEAGRFYISPHRSDLGRIIAGAVQLIQPLLDKYGQRLVVELPADIPVVFADERRIIQVLVNLISNASKYGPSDEEIKISAFADQNWVKIQVADCGPGIPIDRQDQLFRRFMYPNRLDRSEKVGAGLGLSVVKATVESHGGQVGVQDRPGGGSIFWFSLPMRLEG
jgi:signal transduction histidine kinase